MNKAKILDVIKKNLVSVICGVLALAGLISLFYPLGSWYHEFQAKLDARSTDYERAKRVYTTPRFLPIVKAGNAAPERLKPFPNKPVIAEGQRAKDAVQRQSVNLQAQAEQLNAAGRKLLLERSLPAPGDLLFDFVKAYKAVVLIPPTGDTTPPRPDNLARLLGSVMPPDQSEIDAAAKQIQEKEFEPRIIKVGDKEVNRPQITKDYEARIATLPEELRQQRATGYQLYMDRTALSVNNAILESQTPKPTDVWFAQLALWMENDVAGAIASANLIGNADFRGGKYAKARESNVLNDPVKRLVRIDIPMDPSVYVLDRSMVPGVSPAGATAAPVAPKPGENGLPRDFSQSPTGRTCNGTYDVCRFALTLHVDQRQIPLILDELEREKLITVLNMDMSPVDTVAVLDQGFVYGSAPVVEITLTCEAIFMRKNTVPYMPPEIRALLQVTDETPAAK